MQSTATEVHDRHKSYHGQLVLRGLSVAVAAGEILGSPDATGSTVVARASDFVRYLVHSCRPHRCRIDCASARHWRLFPRLAGDKVDWRALGEAWHLSRLLRKPYGTLSGEQKQRLFLAFAMVNQPHLVFLERAHPGTRSRRAAANVAADRARPRPGHVEALSERRYRIVDRW